MTPYSAEEVDEMLAGLGCTIEGGCGIRCNCDTWGDDERKSGPGVWAQVEQLEFALTRRHP
jgi:S-adenosylmethionine-dependent methyltransferase